MMYWTDSLKHYFIRKTVKCFLRTNGDFVDIRFEKKGKKQWFSIPRRDLEELLSHKTSETFGEYQVQSLVSFDQKVKNKKL